MKHEADNKTTRKKQTSWIKLTNMFNALCIEEEHQATQKAYGMTCIKD